MYILHSPLSPPPLPPAFTDNYGSYLRSFSDHFLRSWKCDISNVTSVIIITMDTMNVLIHMLILIIWIEVVLIRDIGQG